QPETRCPGQRFKTLCDGMLSASRAAPGVVRSLRFPRSRCSSFDDHQEPGMPGSRAVTLVTGAGGFIGSHLVERLLALGQRVRVVDNLSTGKLENLAPVLSDIEFVRADLRDEEVCRRAVRGTEVVFHVAALPSVPRSLADPWTSHD